MVAHLQMWDGLLLGTSMVITRQKSQHLDWAIIKRITDDRKQKHVDGDDKADVARMVIQGGCCRMWTGQALRA
eukprot:1158067-Pelagomonas_calceolata.AAC.3